MGIQWDPSADALLAYAFGEFLKDSKGARFTRLLPYRNEKKRLRVLSSLCHLEDFFSSDRAWRSKDEEGFAWVIERYGNAELLLANRREGAIVASCAQARDLTGVCTLLVDLQKRFVLYFADDGSFWVLR